MPLKSYTLYCCCLLIAGIILHSCAQPDERKEAVSFYYWKTNYKLSRFEVDYLQKQQVKKLYLHCFDVVLENNLPMPTGVLIWNDTLQKQIEYIPTVFIENKVFVNADSVTVKLLADKIIGLCTQILATQRLSLSEIQIDCDWTKSTREPYFIFLAYLKQKKLQVSNTLRLYQYKYRDEAGIAPTDYVTLMCYNMGNMKNEKAANSILNIKDLESYIRGQKIYPKPLNIALPIFSWTLLFKQQQFKGILYTNPDLTNGKWKQISNTQYVCLHDYYDINCAQDFYNKEIIRIEQVSAEDIKKARTSIQQHVNNSKNEIIYFDLDSNKIRHCLY